MRKTLSLVFAMMLAVGASAQTNKWWWNSVGKVLPASKWNPGETYKVDAYVINTGQNYSSTNYNVVWGTPPQDANGKNWYELGYELTNGTDNLDQNVEWVIMTSPFSSDETYNGMTSSRWITSDIMGDFYGRRTFTLSEGTILPTTLYLSCGHDDAPSEFYINGTLVYSVSDGWNESEVYQLSSEQRALIKTDGTENVLAFHVHQNYGGAYADCGLYGEPQSYKFIVPTADQTEAGWPGLIADEDYFATDDINDITPVDAECEEWGMTEITGAISDQSVPNSISAYTQRSGEGFDVVVRRHFTIDEPLGTDGWEYYVIVAHDDVFTMWLNGTNGSLDDSYIYDSGGNIVVGTENRTYLPMPDEWTNGQAADPHVVVPYTGNCWVDYPAKRIRKLTDEQLALLNIGADKDNVFTARAHNTTGGFYVDMGIIGVQTKLSVATFIDQLTALIAEVEAYMATANPTDAIQSKMDEALAAARQALESTDITTVSSALVNLQEVYDVYKQMDKTDLDNTITVAEADEMSADFADELATAKTASTDALTASELNTALDNLRNARRVAHADKSENTFTSAEPAVDGEYYLYNVGTKRWLCGGDDWGAHAAVGYPGVQITLEHDSWGDEAGSPYDYYVINTHLNNGGWNESCRLGHGGYMDSGGNAWMFWPQSNGTYTISRNGTSDGDNTENGEGTKNLLGYRADTYCTVETDREGADDPNNQWILVTREMRDALLDAVQQEGDCAEATHFISMPGFNQRERSYGSSQADDLLDWTFEGANIDADHYDGRHVIYGRGDNHDDFVVDIYEQADFNMYQTIYDLPDGYYRVAVNAYLRAEQPETADGETSTWVDPHPTTLLYANNGTDELTTQILDISAGAGKYPGVGTGEGTEQVPSTGFEATKYFQVGEYVQYVDILVNNGELTIGVRKHVDGDAGSGDCLIVDNFRLTYFGDYAPTGISETVGEETIAKNGRIYNINGQFEGTNLRSLGKGVHIVNGKKIVR